MAELGGDRDLARMRPGQLVGGGERDVRPEQRLDATSPRRRSPSAPSRSASARSSAPSARHQLRPVEERQAFLRLEDQRLEAGLAQGDERRHDLPAELDLAAADERQREVGQRREVARTRRREPCAGTTGWMPELEEVEQPVDEQRPAAAVAERERVRPQQEHRPDDLARERRADARRVAHQEVLLEPLGVGRGDRTVARAPKPVVTP